MNDFFFVLVLRIKQYIDEKFKHLNPPQPRSPEFNPAEKREFALGPFSSFAGTNTLYHKFCSKS